MRRAIVLALTLMLAAGCDRIAKPIKAALGPATAFAAPGIVPDSFTTVTRRLMADQQDLLVGVAPDGEHLAVTNWATGDLALTRINSPDTTLLTHNPAPYVPGLAMMPVYSPDGKSIAYSFVRLDKAATELRVTAVGGGATRTLGLDPDSAFNLAGAWLPDGSAIIAERQYKVGPGKASVTDIVRIPLSGDSIRVLYRGGAYSPSHVVISPDGRYIAFEEPPTDTATYHDVYTLPVSGGRPTRITRQPGEDYVLGWTPDGRYILFASDRTGSMGAWVQPMREGRADGEPILVKPDFWRASPLGFDAAGTFYYSVQSGSRTIRMAGYDAQAGKLTDAARALPTAGFRGEIHRLTFSPDGRHVAYSLSDGLPPGLSDRFTVGVRSLSSADEKTFPVHDFKDLKKPVWISPMELAVLGRSQGTWSLYRLHLQDGALEKAFDLPAPHQLDSFDLLKDGAIVTDEVGPNNLFRVMVRTPSGTARELVRIDGSNPAGGHPRMQIRDVHASPDGRWVAYRVLNLSGPDTLEVVAAAGGSPHAVAHGTITTFAFAPDGEALLYAAAPAGGETKGASYQLWRVPTSGGSPTLVGSVPADIGQLAVSPTGRQLAWLAGRRRFELWSMKDFIPNR